MAIKINVLNPVKKAVADAPRAPAKPGIVIKDLDKKLVDGYWLVTVTAERGSVEATSKTIRMHSSYSDNPLQASISCATKDAIERLKRKEKRLNKN